ncbi:MAG: DinB family protein [Bacteroidota bacterium]
MLNEVAEAKAYTRPADNSHSLIDLLYHMLNWSKFTQQRIEKQPIKDMAEFEATDWRLIDPAVHDWQKGLSALRASHHTIIELLQTKNDDFLEEKVDHRKYNFRYLLNGLVQHNVYHLGQVAYLNKLSQ